MRGTKGLEKIKKNLLTVEKECDHCKKTFSHKVWKKTLHCSANCTSKARRKSGKDNIYRACIICFDAFKINKYSKTMVCSDDCHRKLKESRSKYNL